MGKAERNRARNARVKIAAQQAAARKAQQRRTIMIISGSVGLVIVVVVAFVVIALNRHPSAQKGGTTLTASEHSTLAGVPASALAQVQTGPLPSVSSLPLKSISAPPLTKNGKPELLYIGAEFCPYCAAMRWATVIALSKFGSFGQLNGIRSSSTDTFPNTASVTFLNQQYSSPYLTFTPIENEDVNHKQLQAVSSAQQALWAKWEPGGQLGYPFYYFGGKAIETGPLYDPTVLKGLTQAQIVAALKNPNSAIAQNLLGAANYQIAAVCKMTGDTPASVCKAAPIPAIEAKF